MENPTAILTLGLGALVAVAGYLGWSNLKPETPSIIDTDVHSFDSAREFEKELTENVVLSKEYTVEKKIDDTKPEPETGGMK